MHSYVKSLVDSGQPFALDTEFLSPTKKFDHFNARMLGYSVCFGNDACYVPADHPECMTSLQELAALANRRICYMHNAPVDMVVIDNFLGIQNDWHQVRDTMYAAYLLYNGTGQRLGLKHLTERFLGYKPPSLDALMAEHGVKTVDQIPPEVMAEYACFDAYNTLHLGLLFDEELRKLA